MTDGAAPKQTPLGPAKESADDYKVGPGRPPKAVAAKLARKKKAAVKPPVPKAKNGRRRRRDRGFRLGNGDRRRGRLVAAHLAAAGQRHGEAQQCRRSPKAAAYAPVTPSVEPIHVDCSHVGYSCRLLRASFR